MTRRRKERSESREAVGRCGQDVGTGKGKRSTRRGRKNQDASEGHRARDSDLDPISRTPYGPAANEGCIKRPDIRQYLTRLPPDSVLNPGLPTWGRPHTLFRYGRTRHGPTASPRMMPLTVPVSTVLAAIARCTGFRALRYS